MDMEIITNRYRRETGLSAYKHNWFGKRIHNQDYVDWLEKQCTINGVVKQSEQLKCSGCEKPLHDGLCGSCCSDLASGMY